jgi:hypothetical protein
MMLIEGILHLIALGGIFIFLPIFYLGVYLKNNLYICPIKHFLWIRLGQIY